MNNTEFEQLAHANPWDDSPEFQQAASENPERAALVAALQEQDELLAASLQAKVPENLKSRLLGIPAQQQTQANTGNKPSNLHSSDTAQNSTWSYKTLLPLAAMLVLAVTVVTNLLPPASNKAIASTVMEHLYAELALLDMHNDVTMNELNQHLEKYGGSFSSSPEMTALEASVVADCWIEKEQKTHFHMVFMGERGPVTLVISAGESISSPLSIEDERFDGIVVGTPTGYLVVAGEKGEPVEALAEMFAKNISW